MKTVWIIDGAYLLKASGDRKFDYIKLKDELEKEDGGSFYESYYLNSTQDPASDAQNAFHTMLKSASPRGPKIRVQLYKLKDMHSRCPECGHSFERQVQKGVDVGIATLILKLAAQQKYDRLILAAGDGDFEDAIDYVKSELHKEIWICGFSNSVSADLQQYADKMIWLDDMWPEIIKLF
jgi:uncharacterized LabA/DUF88 family protein